MSSEKPPFLVLAPALQTYAWGKKGSQSEACSLKASADPDFVTDENQTYAELWMGTHKKGPAVIKHPQPLAGTLLSDWLKTNQWALGEVVATEFGGELPFLFKVLSVNQALSIQAHPDKKRAGELHSRAPDKYPDANHKPEMVIALREFEGMCGFRPFSEIQSWVVAVPELQQVLGDKVTEAVATLGEDASPEDQVSVLRLAFSSLMSSDPVAARGQLEALVKRVRAISSSSLSREEQLVRQLDQLYPGDVGCFCVFFLNVVPLSRGGSLFLPANEPHCYLSGDVVECMACSDNVVRAGLTPKFKDKDTLCDMLTYTSSTPDRFRVAPQKDKQSEFSEIYDPPIPEFAVARVSVPAGAGDFSLPPLQGPSILLVVEGEASVSAGETSYGVRRGVVLFVSAQTEMKFSPVDSNQGILMYRAYCQLQS
jgi:mannose-6-phosphate isomerase